MSINSLKEVNFIAKINAFKIIASIKDIVNYNSFFANEVELTDKDIEILRSYNFISPTSRTRTIFVPIDIDETLYRKVEVQEWKINFIECIRFKNEMKILLVDISNAINLF